MPKYVCDFDQVYQIGEQVCEAVDELEVSISTYSSHIESDLSTWSGNAKDAFIKTKGEQVETAQKDYTYIRELGEFIKSSSKNIQDLETQLSNLSI